MNRSELKAELEYRITAEHASHGGKMPPLAAAAWRGYLAGLIEWEIIVPDDYWELLHLVPELDPDPAKGILLGKV